MKKFTAVLAVVLLLATAAVITASAEEITYDYSGVYNSLSQDAVNSLNALGIQSADAQALSSLSFEGVMTQLGNIAGENAAEPMRGLLTIVAVLLLCSMLTAYKNTLSADIGATMSTAAALCICCAVTVPAVNFIASAGSVITNSANLFLAYIPVVAVMLASSGKIISSGSYQAAMTAAGQGVARTCADIILPFMYMFLGISITAGIAPEVRLNGFVTMISKAVKWLLTFVMTVFTAVSAARQTLSSSLDSVASRTAKFALSSFVPVVGGALAEAYKTVQGSIGVLKSGLGIFVIVAVAVTFLPVVFRGLGWALCLFVGRALAEALGVDGCVRLLDALKEVFAALIAVLLCVMSVFIISTAAAFTIGGEAG